MNLFRNKSLTLKLILFFAGGSICIFLIIFSFNYAVSKKMFRKDIQENARYLTLCTVNRIETVLASVAKIPEHIAYSLEEGNFTKERLEKMLKMVIENNPEIYGIGVAFEPYAFDSSSLYFAPYYQKENRESKLVYMGAADYNYFSLDWYQIPRELNRPYWIEPYFDDILMVTYSVPFYEYTAEGRKLKGIICADISLDWLTKLVASVKVLETGDAYLISKNGTIVTHNIRDLIMNESIFSVAEARNDVNLREIGRKMIQGESGFVPFISIAREKKSWMSYAPVPSTGWSLAVIFPENEFLAGIRRHTFIVALLGLGGCLILTIVIILISGAITKPLCLMAKATEAIGKGDFSVEMPCIKSQDEVGALAGGFKQMQSALKEYIAKLTETTAIKEHIESELKIAHDIQASIVPRIFPPFPGRKEFDIYALLEPAKEVGGDFYDFFFIDNDNLCVLIGDVSGKGVPAALFMAMAKTLMKATAKENSAPDIILDKVNKEILCNNDSSMFITIFCAMLNVKTGTLSYVNAGHNPPLVMRKSKEAQFLSGPGGVAIGIAEEAVFRKGEITLAAGDTLYMYTDGVTEAVNVKNELFSEEKLRSQLNILGRQNKSVKEIVHELLKNVQSFSSGMPQSDDITMLGLNYFAQGNAA